ncbi:MAG: lipoprotein [Pseudomonadota bacterium]
MFRVLIVVLAFGASLNLSACGQSGPLYLPGNPSEMTTTPVGTTAPAEEDAETPKESGGDPE